MRRFLTTTILFSTISSLSAQSNYTTIITGTERDVIPEGIAVNPADGKIYVSSIGLMKIMAIDQDGTHQDFIKSGQDGFLEGLGMKIDEKKQWLWAVSNHKEGAKYISRVHAFDLTTSATKHKYELVDTVAHLFNDLTIHTNGRIYITDTNASCVYEIDPAKKRLALFVQHDLLARANGIVVSEKGKIFVATRNGLVQIEAQSKKISPLTFNDSKKSFWMDGILFHSNSIIGVADEGTIQYQLNAENDQIISEKFIDKSNSHFHDPTTAAIFSNKLYLLATSYLSVYNQNHESTKGVEDKLGPVEIVVYDLK